MGERMKGMAFLIIQVDEQFALNPPTFAPIPEFQTSFGRQFHGLQRD